MTMNEIVSKEKKELAEQPSSNSGVSPLVMMLARGELKAEHVEQAMHLQQMHEKHEAEKSFSAAMAKFRKIAPKIGRDQRVHFRSKNGVTDYRHTSLGHALSQINPTLGECDLNLSWHPRQEGGQVIVATRLTHTQGHSIEVELRSAPDNSGNKNPIQSIGSAISYLERMGAFSILGLSSVHDDDDGMATEQEQEPEPVINDAEASSIDALLTKLDDIEPGFRKRWRGHYSASWNDSDTPPGLEIPKSCYASTLSELTRRLKKHESAGAA